ncbi:MAG: hypothetical protein WAK89_10470 [Candidatus Sulfotelmatobacter sp.]
MEAQSGPDPEQDPSQVAANVASAHQMLKTLEAKIGKHPELGAAITKLEIALNILAIKTGGLL